MMGVEEAPRVEFVSDGEKELECAYQEHFAALPNVSRALDAMHACGYKDLPHPLRIYHLTFRTKGG